MRQMKVRDLLNSYSFANWEETSLTYCRLMLVKAHGGADAIVICTEDEWKKSAVLRYLRLFDVNVKMFICNLEQLKCTNVINMFNKDNCIIVVVDGLYATITGNRVTRVIKRFFLKRQFCELCLNVGKKEYNISFPYWRQRREEIYLYAKEHAEKLDMLAGSLADDESRETLYEILRCAIENDIYRGKEGLQEKKYWECYRHLENEVWVNCGSAVGDTIVKYVSNGYSYSKIYAFEGSVSEFNGLKQIIYQLNSANIELLNEYIGMNESEDNFDHRFEDIPISLINMDIEGAEMAVLQGAKKVIHKWRPVLAICSYHRVTDLLNIPNLINATVSDYVFFLRKYRGYEPNALNEYLYYAVPKERVL